MRNLLPITILLCFACFSAQAQNWAAFQSGRTYHYKSDTSAFADQSIHFDSVVAVGADSNLTVARRFRAGVDTSQRNLPMFCGREIVAFSDGSFHFKNPINSVLKTQATLGQSFIIDSIAGSIAVVARVYQGNVLGAGLDSIKVFAITGLDSLVLSKSYGILEWPASLQMGRFTLVGIQEDAVGDTMPGFDGFFKYKAGDVYYYESNHYQQDFVLQRDQYQVKMAVDSAIRNAAGLQVYWSGLVRHSMYYNSTLINAVPSTASGSFLLKDDKKNGLVNKSHHEQLRAPRVLEDYDLNADWATYRRSAAVDSNDTYWAGMWSYTSFQPATDGMEFRIGKMSGSNSWLYVSAGGDNCVASGSELRTIIKEGMGLKQVIWSGFETYGDFNLVGSIIDGDTTGVIFTDQVLLSTPSPAEITGLSVSPNPSKGPLYVEWANPSNHTSLLLLDVHGKVCRQVTTSGMQSQLDVQDLPAGVYLLKVVQEGHSAVKRVVVQH